MLNYIYIYIYNFTGLMRPERSKQYCLQLYIYIYASIFHLFRQKHHYTLFYWIKKQMQRVVELLFFLQ